MAIFEVLPSDTPNEGRDKINDNFVDLDGRINEVELGIDAYSTTSASFVQPAVSATVSVTVDETRWMAVGQPVYMVTGGHYTVSSVTDATHVVLTNLGYSGNASVGATVASGKKVSPAGIAGAPGSVSGDAVDVAFVPGSGVGATDVQAAIEEVASDVTGHLSDTSDAHDASAISYAGGTGMSATDVEGAVDELATEKANAADLTAHTGDTTDAHDASAISFVPAGTIAATDVQAAIEEVASEAGSSGAAEDITFTPAGTIAATDVQAAIEEVASEASGGTGYIPPWVKTGSNVVYAAWGDGNPQIPSLLPIISTSLSNQVTGTGIGSTRAMLVKFRIPKAHSVTNVRVYAVGTTTNIFNFGIYEMGGTRVWTSGTFSTTASTWANITANTPFSLAADTDYWLAVTAATSGTAAFNTIPVYNDVAYWGAATPGPLAGLAAGLPEYAQVPVTASAMPATLTTVGALANAAVGPGVPLVFLKGTAS